MKKVIALIFALILAVSFAACGNNGNKASKAEQESIIESSKAEKYTSKEIETEKNSSNSIVGRWTVAEASAESDKTGYPVFNFNIYNDKTATYDGVDKTYSVADGVITFSFLNNEYSYEYTVDGDTLTLKLVSDESEETPEIQYDRVVEEAE